MLTTIHVFAMAHRSYNGPFKLKAITAAEGVNKQAAARQSKIDAKRVSGVRQPVPAPRWHSASKLSCRRGGR